MEIQKFWNYICIYVGKHAQVFMCVHLHINVCVYIEYVLEDMHESVYVYLCMYVGKCACMHI